MGCCFKKLPWAICQKRLGLFLYLSSRYCWNEALLFQCCFISWGPEPPLCWPGGSFLWCLPVQPQEIPPKSPTNKTFIGKSANQLLIGGSSYNHLAREVISRSSVGKDAGIGLVTEIKKRNKCWSWRQIFVGSPSGQWEFEAAPLIGNVCGSRCFGDIQSKTRYYTTWPV